jgi:peptide/nickel transport system permease protein
VATNRRRAREIGPRRSQYFSMLTPLLSGLVLIALASAALFAPLMALESPTSGNLSHRLLPPYWSEGGNDRYPLGTDSLGRDILSRIVFGGTHSLTICMVAILLAGSSGSAVGLVSGYFGGTWDALLMRIVDIALSLPSILVGLLFGSLLGPGFPTVVLVMVVVVTPRFARIVRGEVLSLRTREYVVFARAAGASDVRIIVRHILPNLASTIVVLATLQVGTIMLLEASLSFLGIGVPPPQPTWGLMVALGRSMVASAWWVSLFPGLAILVTILAVNVLGDWLRDHWDPKLRLRRRVDGI